MSPENTRILAFQRLLHLPDTPPRVGRIGILTDTRPVLPSYQDKETPQPPLFNQNGLGRPERMFHTKGVKYWKRAYEAAFSAKKLDSEAAWNIYATLHFGAVDEIKNILKRIKAGEVHGEEEYYNDPEFFRRKLLLKDLRPEKAYFYGLVALRIDERDLRKAQEFDDLGFSHLEKAEEMDPRNPKIKLALWKEHDRKRREKAKKRKQEKKKEEKQERKKSSKPKLINKYNTPELEEQFTVPYYEERIQFWTDDLEKIIEGKEIDYGLLRKEHSKNVRAAKKKRDGRNYDKRKRKYEPQFYDELLNSEDIDAINAYLWGLTALYTAPAGKEPECDRKGFKLLEKATELPPPPHDPRISLPWPIFIRWAIIQELLEKKAHVEPRSHTKSKVLADMLGRVRGKKAVGVEDRKRPGNISQEALPF